MVRMTEEVIRSISPNDSMAQSGDPEYYFTWGEEAVRLVEDARSLAALPPPRRILDFPSGHGRVLRTLKATYPGAEITACDIDRDAVDFCAQTFGAVPLYSHEDPRQVEASGFDLIWCGSLLTHFPAARWPGFLQLFERALSNRGLLVFTVNGHKIIEWLKSGQLRLIQQDPSLIPLALADCERTGFGYRDFPGNPGYGVSVSLPDWVRRILDDSTDLRLVSYTEAGWFSSQDAVACVKQQRGAGVGYA
jgi:hypothetical protein